MIIGSRIHSEVCRLLIGGWASPYDKPHTYQRTAWISRSGRTVANIYAVINRAENTLTITCEEFITPTIPWKTNTVHHNIARDDLFTEAAFTAWATQHLKDLPVITSVTPTPITPEQLTAYLHRSPHWMPSRQRRDGAIIWAWHDRAQAPITVLVPETKQYQDDHELTIEALHKIAKAEGQHPDNLHAHITN